MSSSPASLKRVADYWDSQGAWQTGRGLFWLELEAVQRRLNRVASGNPDLDWVSYSLEHFFPDRLPLPHCLSLGCGEGSLERRLADLRAFERCDASDISEDSIRRARELAQQCGYSHIAYSVEDANRINLPTDHYDAVWAMGAVHHFQALEHVFEQIAGSLRPGGLFILNEYVGPNRFQFPPYHRQVIQACLDLLPAAYRRIVPSVRQRPLTQANRDLISLARRIVEKSQDGDLSAAIGRRLRRLRAASSGAGIKKVSANLPSERSVIALDPSEAVRSAEIVPILQRYFSIVEHKSLGGGLLQFLLADIAGNFEDEKGTRLLEMVFTIEDTLMACGDLASDFAYIVAAPKGKS